ncbi:hypothetical protein BJY04DRAFT_221505 [Aspergillus karnatakaensis]|uniref:uncharacterized protein n=1 Tax=Aspergillus karnatakaensis TaxID=1810916 RepID=UPI003CCCBE7C
MFCGRDPATGGYSVRRHLAEMVHFFGPFPRALLQRGSKRLVEKFFDAEGRVKGLEGFDGPGLESQRFMRGLGEEDAGRFVRFLRRLMVIDPEEKKSTMELLADPWLESVSVGGDEDEDENQD